MIPAASLYRVAAGICVALATEDLDLYCARCDLALTVLEHAAGVLNVEVAGLFLPDDARASLAATAVNLVREARNLERGRPVDAGALQAAAAILRGQL